MVEIETTATSAAVLCRLCLKSDEFNIDIFEEQDDKVSVAQQLFDLLQVKYERSALLPSNICQRCLYMVEAFVSFRDNVQKCETELQNKLIALQLARDLRKSTQIKEQRPGLNGNPGIFEPEENCDITEIDPDQDYESSDEDFSMESDSETEDRSQQAIAKPQQQSDFNVAPTNPSSEITPPNDHVPLAASDSPACTEIVGAGAPPGLVDSLVLDFTAKNTFLCQYCDMAFTAQPDCACHEARHDVATPYMCNFCPLRTTSRQTLIYHIKEAHDPERPYVCALCNKGFCRRSDLKKHTIVHTGVRPFTCPVCAKSFSRNTNLTKHMRIHNSIRPHVCQRCPRSFTTSGELVRHARSHTETKPFKCSRCSASFTRKDKLQLHEQAHYRRESEFLLNQAKTAGAAAGLALAVDGHTRVDTQTENIVVSLNPYGDNESRQSVEDPYRHSILAAQLQQRPGPTKATSSKHHHSRLFTCNICEKTFTRERDLQRHQALHLDSLFMCKQCGTGFSRREKLTRHELEHHSPQFACDICHITFAGRDGLDMHLKMHELQQNVAISTAGVSGGSPVALPKEKPLPQRPSAADMSFYSQMVPTMNLGFYSETRPEDRNGL